MNHKFDRGYVWFFDPDPTKGREQKKSRPCLILSVNAYNNGPSDLLIVLPFTSKKKGIPAHIEVKLAGQKNSSYVMCDQIRCISKERIITNQSIKKVGLIDKKTLEDIERCLKVLLGFK